MSGWGWFGTPEGAVALLRSPYGECPHEVVSWPSTCRLCWAAMFDALLEIECARVVAWLRAEGARRREPLDDRNRREAEDVDAYLGWLDAADAIERGERLQ